MAITRKKNIGLLLIEAGILEPEQLEQALLKQSKEATSGYIGAVSYTHLTLPTKA